MQEGYKLNGSNTFYRVWGILVLVFGGIAVLIKIFAYLFQLIFMSETELFYLIPYDIEEVMIAVYILCFVFLTVEVETKLMTGIILVNDYVKSKGACVCYAVFYCSSFLAVCFNCLHYHDDRNRRSIDSVINRILYYKNRMGYYDRCYSVK